MKEESLTETVNPPRTMTLLQNYINERNVLKKKRTAYIDE